MEPVTHMLTGACLSRAGLNRKAAYATLTMVIAAEFPDIDTLWGLRGPIEGFQHHRGITHTFLGLPFEAAFIVAGVYGWHWWRVRRVKAGSRFPSGMTTREATATATANTGVSPLRGTIEPSRSGRDDAFFVDRDDVFFVDRDDVSLAGRDGASFAGRDDAFWGSRDDGDLVGSDDTFVGVQARRLFPSGTTKKGPTAARTVSATTAVTDERVVRPLTVAPVRWGVLYGLALVALLSHLLLDYTNNYGLRPFFPFDDRWYAASIVFIFDPVMFALLLAGLAAPWLFGLVGSEVGAKKQRFRPRGWAIAALLGVVGWWGLREVEHARAVQMALAQSIAAPAENLAQTASSTAASATEANPAQVLRPNGLASAEPLPVYLQTQRTLASPDPFSPFHWSAAMDFGPVYQMAEIDTRSGTVVMGETMYPKPGRSAAVLTAEESKLGRVYMDWSQMPVVEVTAPGVGTESGAALDGVEKVVTFRDLRFMGGWLGSTGRSALTGTVGLNAQGEVVRETMDERAEGRH